MSREARAYEATGGGIHLAALPISVVPFLDARCDLLTSEHSKWRQPARWLILAFVAVLALDHYYNHLSRTPGIDFYQYWAVPTARRASPEVLGSPYSQDERYATVLAGVAERSDDDRLKAVTDYRQEPGFASTPLLYVMGSWLPSNYTTALRSYQVMQYAALGLALFLLARRAAMAGLDVAILGLLMFVFYMPVLSDLRVLNTNAFQLAALAGAATLLAGGGAARRDPRDALALSLTILVVFLKPVWAPLPLLVVAHVVWRGGWKGVARPLAVGGGVAALLCAWPALVFGPVVWHDWYQQVFGSDAHHLVYSIEEGNRSAPLVLAEATGWSLGGALSLLLAVVGLSLLAMVVFQRRGSAGTLADGLLVRPERALSLGIVAMLALSPLAWWHYYIMALIPIFVLVSPGTSKLQVGLACLSFLLSSGRLGPLYVWFADGDWATIFGVAFAWLPLWVGLLLPFAPRRESIPGQ